MRQVSYPTALPSWWDNGGMNDHPAKSIAYFARTDARRPFRTFGIKREDRLSHMYVIGKTGTGKSTLLETMIRQDLAHGEGLALIDPHGDLVARVVADIPEQRKNDVVYFDVPDRSQPYGYNPLRHVHELRRPLAAAGMLEVFKKMWSDAWGVRMEHILRNALLALLDQPAATLADILRLLSDQSFRRQVIENITNPQVETFWESEFSNYSYRFRADSIAPVQNKVGAFLADPTLNRVLTAPARPISFRRLMDEGKVLLVNLSRGQLGEDSAALLGGLLVTTIGVAAFSRADVPEAERRPFFLYVDEFQNFTTLSVANMASELRKYRVGTIWAHQYLHQLEPDVRHAVLGNAGTLVSFRLGAHDADFLAKEFRLKFDAVDLQSLPNYHIYLKLMIDGAPSQPFSAVTLRPNDVALSSTPASLSGAGALQQGDRQRSINPDTYL